LPILGKINKENKKKEKREKKEEHPPPPRLWRAREKSRGVPNRPPKIKAGQVRFLCGAKVPN